MKFLHNIHLNVETLVLTALLLLIGWVATLFWKNSVSVGRWLGMSFIVVFVFLLSLVAWYLIAPVAFTKNKEKERKEFEDQLNAMWQRKAAVADSTFHQRLQQKSDSLVLLVKELKICKEKAKTDQVRITKTNPKGDGKYKLYLFEQCNCQ